MKIIAQFVRIILGICIAAPLCIFFSIYYLNNKEIADEKIDAIRKIFS